MNRVIYIFYLQVILVLLLGFMCNTTQLANSFGELIKEAKNILDENWTGKSTIPASGLYPHQWSWDSGFISIGYSHYDLWKARTELESLFKGQWSNGMLPHIIFNPEVPDSKYFPGAGWWQSNVSKDSPEAPRTSGIVDPPIHSTAVRKIYEHEVLKNSSEAQHFLQNIFPHLDKWHSFLYKERDYSGNGLVYIRHMWESGMDNSPNWDSILERMVIEKGSIPPYNRTDNKGNNTHDRPSTWFYNRAVWLMIQARNHSYDELKIRKVCPFLVEDVLFNSVLVRANADLAFLASEIGVNPKKYHEWHNKTLSAMNNKLWNDQLGIYLDWDIRANAQIQEIVADGLSPLYAFPPSGKNTRDSHVPKLVDSLKSQHFTYKNGYPIATYDLLNTNFSTHNYWRGPVWININWFAYLGLLDQQYYEEAKTIFNALVTLPKISGFREYFNPLDGSPLGAFNFSWSCALFIDAVLS